MDISNNAKVSCLDGPCGELRRVILKPTTKSITHLVIGNDSFPETDYLVSIDHVVKSTTEQIRLNCSLEELSKMPVFNQTQFKPSELAGFIGGLFLMWPYYAPAGSYIIHEKDNIPSDELAMRRGARVEAADGDIGSVDEFLINPKTDQITHIVLREGHLWGHKEITIPISKIDHFTDTIVYLKLNKKDIEKLPIIPIEHNWSN